MEHDRRMVEIGFALWEKGLLTEDELIALLPRYIPSTVMRRQAIRHIIQLAKEAA